MEQLINDLVIFVDKALLLHEASYTTPPKQLIKMSSLRVGVISEMAINYQPLSGKVKIEMPSFELKEQSVSLALDNQHIEQHLLPRLKTKLIDYLSAYQNNPLLDYHLRIELNINLTTVDKNLKPHYLVLDYIYEQKRHSLIGKIDHYLTTKVWQGQYPLKTNDIMLLTEHLLDNGLFPNLSGDKLIAIFQQMMKLNGISEQSLQESIKWILYSLKNYFHNQFLPQFYSTSTSLSFIFSLQRRHEIIVLKEDIGDLSPYQRSMVELMTYTATLIVKYSSSDENDIAVDFLRYAVQLGSQDAASILKIGSGRFNSEEMVLNSDEVECIANDILATFTINIKQECQLSYEKALDFINHLLQKGFAKSYQIDFHSQQKCFLPIEQLGESKTQQFFAHILQYPQLNDKLAQYANLAIQQFEWYTDVENEYCCMPGTYAVFGLALRDESYFSLADHYFSKVDEEHQRLQAYFIIEFIKKWGVNSAQIPRLLSYIAKTRFSGKSINIAQWFETKENLAALLAQEQLRANYHVENDIYFIWGSEQVLANRIPSADIQLRPYLQQILALAG